MPNQSVSEESGICELVSGDPRCDYHGSLPDKHKKNYCNNVILSEECEWKNWILYSEMVKEVETQKMCREMGVI